MRPVFDPTGGPDVLVEKMIGTAYETVKRVYCHLPEIRRLDGVLAEIPTLAQTTVDNALAVALPPILAQMDEKVQAAEGWAGEAEASAEAAAQSALAATKVNMMFPFTSDASQMIYDVTVISGQTDVNTAGMALWVEGAIEFDFTILSATTFMLNDATAYPENAQMRVILNAHFNDLVHGFDQLLGALEQEYKDAAALNGRWCGLHLIPPTTRLDNSPLQEADEYQNRSDKLRYSWNGSTWVALNSSAQQLEVRLADPTQGARKVAYRNRTAQDKFDDFVSITDYYEEGDNNLWHQAWARALLVSPNVHFPRKPDPVYLFGAPTNLPNDAFVVVTPGVTLSAIPATNAAGTGIVSIINTNGKRGIKLFNAKFDGGVREVMTAKAYVRPIRFINCYDVQMVGCEVINNPDWSVSFEQCDGVRVSQYTQRSFVYADTAMNTKRAGGRDGLHFLDCKNFYAFDLDIESGDDCVGITSQVSGTFNGNVDHVRGKSVIASLVIYNEEFAPGTSDYAAMPLETLKISNVQGKQGTVSRNVVRVARYNVASTIKDVSVTGVRGTSSNHGMQLSHIDGLFVDDSYTISMLQHGVYINGCTGVTGSVRGKSLLAGFDGVQIFGGSDQDLIATAYDSANYGVHLNGLSDSTIVPISRDNGALALASSSGGNLRIVNCSGVEVPHGVASGDPSKSYYGILESSGNTNCRIGAGVKTGGVVPRSGGRSATGVYQEPAVAVRFKEEISGTLTVTSPLGCSVTRDSLGRYRVTFTKPMRTTLFNFQVFATAVGAVRSFRLVSNPAVSELVFETIDAAGAVARCDMVSVLVYDL